MPEKEIVQVNFTDADDSPEGNRKLALTFSDNSEATYPITAEQKAVYQDIVADWVAGLNEDTGAEDTTLEDETV